MGKKLTCISLMIVTAMMLSICGDKLYAESPEFIHLVNNTDGTSKVFHTKTKTLFTGYVKIPWSKAAGGESIGHYINGEQQNSYIFDDKGNLIRHTIYKNNIHYAAHWFDNKGRVSFEQIYIDPNHWPCKRYINGKLANTKKEQDGCDGTWTKNYFSQCDHSINLNKVKNFTKEFYLHRKQIN